MNMVPSTFAVMDGPIDIGMLAQNDAFLRKVLELSSDCVKILDADGSVCFMNGCGMTLMEIDDFAQVDGAPWISLWPEQERQNIADAVAAATMGRTVRMDAFCPTAKGTPKWWDVTVAPVDIDGMNDQVLVVISRDITDRISQAETMRRLLEEKDQLLAEKDLLMHEVHHRAKNSLQLVQGLLSIQSRSKGMDAGTSAQLAQSAARVRTIAAMHDRLYRSQAALDVEVKPYLASLVNDIQSSLSVALGGRRITFESDDAVWIANDIPALGLVLTELMTNAVKFGAGDIAVVFRQPTGEQAILAVDDQGGCLPDGFDPAAGTGLGMKLVTNLLHERTGGALEFSCENGYTRFIARMPKPALPG